MFTDYDPVDVYKRQDISREREVSESLEELAGEDFSEIEGRVGSAPIVRFVSMLVEQAYLKRASDIHIEPCESVTRVRFRIDGDLVDITELSPSAHASLVTRIKIMADMDIAERRLPLDGRFNAQVEDSEISVRVSSMPTVFGEKIVMRLLTDSKSGIYKIQQLGMTCLLYTSHASGIKTHKSPRPSVFRVVLYL